MSLKIHFKYLACNSSDKGNLFAGHLVTGFIGRSHSLGKQIPSFTDSEDNNLVSLLRARKTKVDDSSVVDKDAWSILVIGAISLFYSAS